MVGENNGVSGVDGFSFDQLHSSNWDSVLDKFSYDMDPWNVDIVKIADRFRNYLSTVEERNLEVSARMIIICAALLKMKTDLLSDDEQEEEFQEFEEEPFDDFEQHEEFEEERREIEVPEEDVRPKVKKKPARRVSLKELKNALNKALDIQEKRKKRRERRLLEKDDFIDLDEKDIAQKLDRLMERLESYFEVEGTIPFQKILEKEDKLEKLEKFSHLLHLETDEKVACEQEEFLGELKISPLKNN